MLVSPCMLIGREFRGLLFHRRLPTGSLLPQWPHDTPCGEREDNTQDTHKISRFGDRIHWNRDASPGPDVRGHGLSSIYCPVQDADQQAAVNRLQGLVLGSSVLVNGGLRVNVSNDAPENTAAAHHAEVVSLRAQVRATGRPETRRGHDARCGSGHDGTG